MRLRSIIGVVAVFTLLGGQSAVEAQSSVPPDTTATSPSTVLSDPFVRTHGTEGIHLLYNMRSDRAEQHFQKIDKRYPQHPVGPFLKGLNLWWTIMLDLADTTHDEAFFDLMDEVIERADALLEENADHFDALLFKAAAHGFKARLASNRKNWWPTLRNAQKAIGPARRVAEIAPEENGDYVFGKGLYDYYTAILEEEYPATKAFTWMIPDGNRKRGLRLLKQTAETGRYVQTEGIYYLTQIHYLYEEDYSATRRYVTRLRERHPDNPYFHNYEGRVYAKWNRWDQARTVFSEVVDRCQQEQAGYTVHMEEVARYYLGRERLQAGAYDEALAHLNRLNALTNRDVEHNRYQVLGALYTGMVYDVKQRREKAKHKYRRALDLDGPGWVHERAQQYLEEPYAR